ncbi:MAG: hypothetical protein J6V36_02200 [Clostridia bacterium]|nr:hypothetical protein [Clostridia bacterium]
MNVFTVSFFGHRKIIEFEKVSSIVEDIIEKIFNEHESIEFLVGRNGDFDSIVSSAIIRCKKKYNNKCSNYFVLVMPYETSSINENQESFLNYYDEIEICPYASAAHYKKSYEIRNKKMIERSDLIIFYVNEKSGGAYKTLKYALRLGKKVINIGIE